MTLPIAHYRRQVALAATLAAVVSVVVIGIGYAIARGIGNPQHAHDIAIAGGVLLLAGIPGFVLAVVLTGRVRGGASFGFVSGIGVRLPVGGVLAFYGLNWGLAQTANFSQIVAGTYLVLLVIEVICLSPAVKRTAAAEAKDSSKKRSPDEPDRAGDEESV